MQDTMYLRTLYLSVFFPIFAQVADAVNLTGI